MVLHLPWESGRVGTPPQRFPLFTRGGAGHAFHILQYARRNAGSITRYIPWSSSTSCRRRGPPGLHRTSRLPGWGSPGGPRGALVPDLTGLKTEGAEQPWRVHLNLWRHGGPAWHCPHTAGRDGQTANPIETTQGGGYHERQNTDEDFQHLTICSSKKSPLRCKHTPPGGPGHKGWSHSAFLSQPQRAALCREMRTSKHSLWGSNFGSWPEPTRESPRKRPIFGPGVQEELPTQKPDLWGGVAPRVSPENPVPGGWDLPKTLKTKQFIEI